MAPKHGKLHGVNCVVLLKLVGIADPVSEAAECSSVAICGSFWAVLAFRGRGKFFFLSLDEKHNCKCVW